MFAASLPGRSDPVDAPVLAAPASRQSTHNHALFIEHVEVTPLHRLNVVVTGNGLSALGALLRPQSLSLANANHKRILFHFVVSADHFPTRTQAQQLFKRLFRCHFLDQLYDLSPTYIPLKLSRNRIS